MPYSEMVSPAELKGQVKKILPQITQFRHELHQIPEIQYQEFKTAAKIRERIARQKIEIEPPLIKTDTVAILKGKGQGKNVTLRADIDALPVEESSGVPWFSRHPGFSHACGHDGHAAILAGTLEVLSTFRERFAGSVRFVFQPAEEQGGGGKRMVEKGLLARKPLPAAVFALHGWPEMALGSVGARSGAMMAASNKFTITIKGYGGHGASPHRTVDPIVTGALLINSLQSLVSRGVDPLDPVVVSVCTIHGGHAGNVIPDEVVMQGTTRHFGSGESIKNKMTRIINGVCDSTGAGYEFDYEAEYTSLVNTPEKVDFARSVVETYLSPEVWADDLPRTMGAEDFSFYLQKVPGAFLRLGLGKEHSPLHNPAFDFNDQAIETGITLLTALALETLKAPS